MVVGEVWVGRVERYVYLSYVSILFERRTNVHWDLPIVLDVHLG